MSIQRAIEAAKSNLIKPVGRNSISRFGAVLTSGSLSFIGLNSYKTHPLQARFAANEKSVHIHCEIAAIIEAIRYLSTKAGSHRTDITDLSDFEMYVARVLKDGSAAMARPCTGCQRALTAFGITKVSWTT